MFFSVNNIIKIGGKKFIPCVCYEVTPYLQLTVDNLVKEGKVTLYDERVYFCNGKVIEKKLVVKENLTTVKLKKEKKSKKEIEVIEADIPSPEEIADEGF